LNEVGGSDSTLSFCFACSFGFSSFAYDGAASFFSTLATFGSSIKTGFKAF
jgi:hypothetical protein